MRTIAFRGLLGRRRDTVLLWSVVVLSFLFLTLSTTLITSLQAADAAQRVSTYGSWQVLCAGLTPEEGEQLAQTAQTTAVLPMVPVSGIDYFAGDNSYFLSTYSPELEELGQLQLREGRWPETSGEVALEYARIAALGLEVGDVVSLGCTLQLPMTGEFLQQRWESYYAAGEEATAEYREQALEVFRSGDWARTKEGLWIGETLYPSTTPLMNHDHREFPLPYGFFDYLSFLSWYRTYHIYNPGEEGYAAALETWHYTLSPDSMTEEEFLTALSNYLMSATDLYPKASKELNLLGYEGLTVRVSYEAVDPNGDTYMTVILTGKYTVCGILETCSDRWDSGSLNMPEGFLAQEGYQLLMEAQQSVLDAYPGFERLDFDTMVLLRAGEDVSARELWRSLLPFYNATLDKGEDLISTQMLFYIDPDYVSTVENGESFYLNQDPQYQITYNFLLADEEASCLVSGSAYLADLNGYDQSADQPPKPWLSSQSGSTPDPVEPAAVLDLGGEEWYIIPLEDFLSYNFTLEGMSITSSQHLFPYEVDKPDDYTGLRINRFGYPSSADSGESLLTLVMGILFVTTVCAVCQICFTQIRRRLRRVVLLKSVGATAGQVAAMLGWEFLYFWLASLPVGTALGLGGAKLALQILGNSRGKQLLLTLQPGVLLAALAAGTLALALGMCVPMVMAVGVPLTGRSTRKKPLPPPKKETRQDFFHITLRGYASKKGRMAGSFALCAFMMSILVLCLFLGFRFLGEYREAVERDSKPDYWLRFPYAMSLRQREEYLQELEELGFDWEIESYFVGEEIWIPGIVITESPLMSVASCPINLYGIHSSDPLFARYSAAATVGSLDPTAFDAGEQVLLMVPLYRDTAKADTQVPAEGQGWGLLAAAGIDTSYYAEYDGIYSRDTTVQVGDIISLWTSSISVVGESYSSSFQSVEVTVGAILYYFPDQGIWPVSGSGEGYQIVTSLSLVSRLLPSAGHSLTLNAVQAYRNQSRAFPALKNAFGFTDFYIHTGAGTDLDEADTALLVFARGHCMDIEIYHESNEKILQNAVNNILLACLLGLTAVLLALMIFFNTVASDLEQERSRLGILQSLGVSNRQLVLRQLYLGLVSAGAALVIANLLLWGGVALYAGVSGKVLGNLLWGYPVAGHILLCLGMAAALVLLYMAPMLGLRKYLPIDNIRSRK